MNAVTTFYLQTSPVSQNFTPLSSRFSKSPQKKRHNEHAIPEDFEKMTAAAGKFRTCFKVNTEKIRWYPGHMASSLKHMQAIMRKIDCVIEVHDGRIPFSGRNPKFLFSLTGSKPHILALNKKDLIDKSSHGVIMERCREDDCANVVFTNCLDQQCKGLHKIIPLAWSLIQQNSVFPKTVSSYTMMVVGVPNVGKSSLINALRNISLAKGNASRVGPNAGVTRAVQEKIKVSTEPLIYLIDTPGILSPRVDDVESGMKLALCSCLNDSNVGISVIADFLLYWMNKTENFCYVDYFGLAEPTDEIVPLLVKIAVDRRKIKKVRNVAKNCIERIPDLDAAAEIMVNAFRRGKFGDLCLDKNHFT